MDKPNYYAILTADVRYDTTLSSSEKLFYAEITALSQKEGVCWASNKYFSELYSVSTSTVSGWVRKLSDKGYISLEYDREGKEIKKRSIRIQKTVPPYSENPKGGIQISEGGYSENRKENSTSINNTRDNNRESQISVQEWLGEVPPDHFSAPSWRFFAKQCMSHPFPILPRQVKSRAHTFADNQMKLEGDPKKEYREWCRHFTNWVKKQRFLDESGS